MSNQNNDKGDILNELEIGESSPIILWKSSDKNLENIDRYSPSQQKILTEVFNTGYLETNLQVISQAFYESIYQTHKEIVDLFNGGFFKQITIYQKGSVYIIMHNKNDKNHQYTPTELRIFQKAKPNWIIK